MAPIDVTILRVKDPGHFWAKEVPGRSSTSEALEFLQLLEKIDDYTSRDEFLNMHTYNPKKGEVYLVKKMDGDRWYRARVTSIILRKHLAETSCFLLDYGETIKIPMNRLRDIPAKFLKLPFQAREYCLYGLVPLSLKVSFDEDQATMQPAVKWDTSAVEYFDEILVDKPAKVDIHHVRQDGVYLITLYVNVDQKQMNVNEELLRLNFAARIEEQLKLEEESRLTNRSNGSGSSVSPEVTERLDGIRGREGKRDASVSPDGEARDDRQKTTLREYIGLPPLRPNQLVTRSTVTTTSPESLPEHTPAQQMKASVKSYTEQSSGKRLLAAQGLSSKRLPPQPPASSAKDTTITSPTTRIALETGRAEELPERNLPSPDDVDKLRMSTISTRQALAKLQAIKERAKMSAGFLKQQSSTETPGQDPLHPDDHMPSQTLPHTLTPTTSSKTLSTGATRLKSKSPILAKMGTTRLPFAVDGRFTLSSEEVVESTVKLPRTLSSPARQDQRQSRQGDTSSDPDFYNSSSDEPTQYVPSLMPQPKVIGQRLLKQITSAHSTSPAPDVQGLIYSHIKKTSRVLVQGDRPPRPMMSIEQSPFPDSIQKKLTKLGFPSPSDIQAYSWPIILRGRDMVGISSSGSGKSLAFLLPLITQSLQPSTYSSLPPGNGPLVIIVSPRWQKASEVYDQCSKFVPSQRGSKVILIHGAGYQKQQEDQLLNGCSILVATLPCLLRMLRDDHTSLNRLSHLVLDDADVLCEDFTDKVKELMSEYASVLSRPNSSRTAPRQLLLFSSNWTMGLGSFLRAYMAEPIVVIASSLEAAVYARVGQVVLKEEPNERDGFLRGLLDSGSPTQARRMIIFTNGKEQAKRLQEVLVGGFCHYTLLAFKDMPQHHLDTVKTEWNQHHRSNSQLVLVCTDDVIQDLNIMTANTVVHYDFPSSKQKFGLRLSCMMDRYSSQIEETKVSECRSILLISREDKALIPGLVNLLKRCSFAIPSQLNVEEAIKEKEKSKKGQVLCHQLKAFGECRNESSCLSRHEMFADADTPGCHANHIRLPSSGVVKILITHIVDATNFYARILEYRSTEASDPVAMLMTHLDLAFEMVTWFSDPNHCVGYGTPLAGDLCCVEDSCHVFHRVKVQRSKRLASALFEEKEVQFVDQGRIERVPVSKLLKLPDHLYSKPYQAVEIFVCRVKPVDGDTDWTTQAGFFVYDKIHDKQMEGKINLSLDNTLWLDPVLQRVHLPSIKTTVNMYNVRQELLDAGLAADNREHITKLREKCKGKVTLPDMIVPSAHETRSQPMLLPDPIYLSISDDYYPVLVSSVHTPGCLYLQLSKYAERLDKLMEEINSKLSDNNAPPPPDDWQPRVGEVCLAKFHEDNRWNRVRILDNPNDGLYEVFYLDYGDREEVSKNWLHPAWNNILKLSFQAIQCRLTNVDPKLDEWSDTAGDALWDMCLDGDDKKLLMAKIVSEIGSGSESGPVGSSHYEIELFDTSSERDVVIGQELVHAGDAAGNEAMFQSMFPIVAVDDDTEPPLSTEIANMLSQLCLELYNSKNESEQLELADHIKELVTTLSQSECSTEVDIAPLCRLVACGRGHQWVNDSLADSLALVCFKIPKNCEVLCQSGGLKELCQLLLKTKKGKLQEYVSYVLMLSSGNPTSIHDYGGIEALCRVLSTTANVDIISQASAALAALVTDNNKNQCTVNEAGGLRTVCKLLNTMRNKDCLMNLLRALTKMAANGGTRDEIRDAGGLLTLCDLMWDTVDSPMVHLIAQALTSLSCNNPQNIEVMADQALMDCVESQLMCMSHSETTHRLLVTLHIRLIEHTKTLTDQSQDNYQPSSITKDARAANQSDPARVPVSKVISIQEVIDGKTDNFANDEDVLADMPPLEVDSEISLRRTQPKVLWSQRPNSVILSVQLRGVLTFDLDVTSTSVRFSTIQDETHYAFNLDLYSRVRAPEHVAVPLGNEMLITLYKETVGTNWSRLTASKTKLGFIGIDFERWNLEDSDSEEDISHRFGIKKKPPLPHRPKNRSSQNTIPVASVPELDTSESSDSYSDEANSSDEDPELGFSSDQSDSAEPPHSS